MAKSYIEEFNRKYERPSVNPITIGFSGIDPSVKPLGQSETNIETVNELIKSYLSRLTIRIDSGNVDPSTIEAEPPSIVLKPDQIPHERLSGLLGGNSEGHYHLSRDEYARLGLYPDYEELAGSLKHQELGGLQGGKDGEYYHVTEEELHKLSAIIEYLYSAGQTPSLPYSERSHEKLRELLGGDSSGHWHLTEEQAYRLEKVLEILYVDGTSRPEFPYIKSHEKLDDLHGGTDNEHYHLNKSELEMLQKLMTVVYPDGATDPVIASGVNGGTNDHEKLQNLLGGDEAGHYHMTEEELTKIRDVLSVLYASGKDKPVFPSGEDYETPQPVDPFGGLPRGNPPAWEPNDFPSGYSAYEKVHKMYYWVDGYSKSLLVAMTKSSLTDSFSLQRTGDLTKWSTVNNWSNKEGIQYANGTCIKDYCLCSVGNVNVLYMCLSDGTGIGSAIYYTTGGALSRISTTKAASSNWDAVCYSQKLGFVLFVNETGRTVKLVPRGTAPIDKEGGSCSLSRVNPGCAAWSPEAYVFCVSGSDGTATSLDGENWEKHTDAPHNLVDLTYREDMHCFLARGGDDKLFYVSGDGEEWTHLNSTPIPLETVAAVDYNADLGWYCAVGGTGKHAYFSKDLEHWISTKITNGTAIEAGSVIWMPSIQKYVLMPTSGNYFYTFDPNAWSDE